MAVCEAAYALRAGDGAGGVDRGVQATLAHCQVCWVGTEDLMRLFRRVCSRLEVFMVRGRKDHWKVAIWQGGLECKAQGLSVGTRCPCLPLLPHSPQKLLLRGMDKLEIFVSICLCLLR